MAKYDGKSVFFPVNVREVDIDAIADATHQIPRESHEAVREDSFRPRATVGQCRVQLAADPLVR